MTSPVHERLQLPEAFLSRTDLRELGLERRAIDAIFRACDVVVLPGYKRPLIRVGDYTRIIDESTYRECRCGPRPCACGVRGHERVVPS